MVRQSGATLMGFNNNVRYRGHRFHLQTEDSGREKPHILTHLFANGGHIIETLRCDYSQHLADPRCTTIVARMMREQHLELAMLLRDGHLDQKLAWVLNGSQRPSGSPTADTAENPMLSVPPPRVAPSHPMDAGDDLPPPSSVFGMFQEETLDDLILRQLELL